MPNTIELYAQALFEAISVSAEKDHDLVIDNLVLVMKANNDLDKFEKVVTAFEQLISEESGKARGDLQVAHNIELNKNLVEELNIITNKKLDLKKNVDETLLGGMVLRVDDVLLDSSVKKELDALKKHLTD